MTHPHRRNKNAKIVKTKKYQDPAKGSKFIPSKPGIIDKVFKVYDPSIAEKKDYDEWSELKQDFKKTGRGKEFRGRTFVDRKTGKTMLDRPYERDIVGPERVYKAPDVRYFPEDEPVEEKKSGGRAGYQDPGKGSKFIPSKPGIIDKLSSHDFSIFTQNNPNYVSKKKYYDIMSEKKQDYVKTGRGKEFRRGTLVDKKTGQTYKDSPRVRNIIGPERVYKSPDVRYFPEDQPVEKKKSGGRAGYSVGGIAKKGISKILIKK